MKANYIISYDITNPRRLSRVYKLMKQSGIHIQYSVFYCRLTWQNLVELKGKLSSIINPKKDDVRIYPLPSELKVAVMGLGDRIPEGVSIFLQ